MSEVLGLGKAIPSIQKHRNHSLRIGRQNQVVAGRNTNNEPELFMKLKFLEKQLEQKK